MLVDDTARPRRSIGRPNMRMPPTVTAAITPRTTIARYRNGNKKRISAARDGLQCSLAPANGYDQDQDCGQSHLVAVLLSGLQDRSAASCGIGGRHVKF